MANKALKTSITCIIFIGLGLFPAACDLFCRDSCGCGSSRTTLQYYSVRSFESMTLKTNGEEVDPDLFFPYQEITKAFRINETEPITSAIIERAGTLGLAFACSPIPPISSEKILNIQIFNKKEVVLENGDLLLENQEISEYFQVGDLYNESTFPIADFLDGGLTISKEDIFKLQFIKDPGKSIQLVFNIQIYMENDLSFLLENEKLSIE